MTHNNFRLMFTMYFITFGIIIALFGSLVGYQMQTVNIKENIDSKSEEAYIVKKFNIIKPSIDRLDTIVNSLAQNRALYDFIKKRTDESIKDVNNIFYAIASSDSLIMQARLYSIRMINIHGTNIRALKETSRKIFRMTLHE